MDKQLKEASYRNAKTIHDLGWRQGAIFETQPTKIQIPPIYGFGNEEDLLIVATQSCSVVSTNFEANPFIEAMVIKKLKKFNPKLPEAIGKNQRQLHLKLLNSVSDYVAIGCDINKRFFIDRSSLVEFTPSNFFILEKEEPKKLAAWLGRSYTRIALPNELVNRMRQTLLPIIEEILKIRIEDLSSLYEKLTNIYLKWEPKDDNSFSPPIYRLWLFFVCENNESSDELGSNFFEKLTDFQGNDGKDGIKIEEIKFQTKTETFLSELDLYDRFSEWDYFTSLDKIQLTFLN